MVQVPEQIKAMAAHEARAGLKPLQHSPGPLQAHEVDIQVTHNGLCHTDLHFIDNELGITPFPFVPGHEIVGVVAAKGELVTNMQVGDRVGYAWIKNSCGDCGNCISGDENVCEKGAEGTIVGGNKGGWQQFFRGPAKFAFKIPAKIDSASAAPLLCAGVTVYAPLRRLIKRPATRVTCVGIGGLGHLAIQFATAMGAEVTALSTSSNKEAEAKKFGADRFVVAGSEAHKAMEGTQDLIVNSVSSASDFGAQMKMLRANGTLLLLGLTTESLNIPVTDLLFGQRQIAGSAVGGRRDMVEMFEFAAAKGIRPQVEEMPLSKVNDAIQRLRENKPRYRIVLTTDI